MSLSSYQNFLAGLPIFIAVVLSLNADVAGQTFSKDPEYTAFYKDRVNPESAETHEDTIAVWWTIEQFGVPKVPLAKLHEYLRQHRTLYPDSKHAERVADHIEIVERMLKGQRPSSEQRIEQLIFDLRDLNHRQFSQPNSGLRIVGPRPSYKHHDGTPLPDEIVERLRARDDAADHLRDIGYDCIPALIDHIDDKTLTRSVTYWRDSVFSHHVLTVGECCQQILDVVLPTARRFEFGNDPELTKQAMKNHYQHLISQKLAEP